MTILSCGIVWNARLSAVINRLGHRIYDNLIVWNGPSAIINRYGARIYDNRPSGDNRARPSGEITGSAN